MSALEILESIGAVLRDGHFVYTSGKHGEIYINKDALYPHTKQTSLICKEMAEQAKGTGVEIVLGPAYGGIILSSWVAYHLSDREGHEILGVYTTKDTDGRQVFTRGYDLLVKGKKVMVVEDIINTGGSLLNTLDTVREAGGIPVSACALVSRTPEFGQQATLVPFKALATLPAQAWEESELPQHIKDRPVNTKVGHGKKYLESLKG